MAYSRSRLHSVTDQCDLIHRDSWLVVARRLGCVGTAMRAGKARAVTRDCANNKLHLQPIHSKARARPTVPVGMQLEGQPGATW
jgi:hypothetical protein